MAEEINNKLLKEVYITDEIRIRKIDGEYFVEVDFGDFTSSTEISLGQFSVIVGKLSLMKYEHFNPDHYDLKPIGFSK